MLHKIIAINNPTNSSTPLNMETSIALFNVNVPPATYSGVVAVFDVAQPLNTNPFLTGILLDNVKDSP